MFQKNETCKALKECHLMSNIPKRNLVSACHLLKKKIDQRNYKHIPQSCAYHSDSECCTFFHGNLSDLKSSEDTLWYLYVISNMLKSADCWSNVILIVRLILSGNSGDSLAFHRGMSFTTRDQENDDHVDHNCAIKFKGAWWYRWCHRSNLNGLYLRGNHSSYADGVNWLHWRGYHYSLKRTEMKMRPVDFWTVMFVAQKWYSINLTKKPVPRSSPFSI